VVIAGPILARGQARPSPIQVIPLQAGTQAAASGSFVILSTGEPDLPDVVYLEQLTSALYMDKPQTVGSYLMMERLCQEAMTPLDTTKFLEQLLK
jgi:hypothetical protein